MDGISDLDPRELERLHGQAFSWALTCTGGQVTEAEDVLQMTYVAIMEGRARFDGRSSLRTWLFAVIRNTARSRWRLMRAQLRSLARLAHFASPGEPAAADASPAETLEQRESAARVLAAWRALPARQREVLDLVFYRDLSIAEAAEVLGVGVGTARVHYERAKAALRRSIREGGDA